MSKESARILGDEVERNRILGDESRTSAVRAVIGSEYVPPAVVISVDRVIIRTGATPTEIVDALDDVDWECMVIDTRRASGKVGSSAVELIFSRRK